MRAILENMIGPDYVLCYTPRFLGILGERMTFLKFTGEQATTLLISVVALLRFWKFSEKRLNIHFAQPAISMSHNACLKKSNSEIDNFWKHVQ